MRNEYTSPNITIVKVCLRTRLNQGSGQAAGGHEDLTYLIGEGEWDEVE